MNRATGLLCLGLLLAGCIPKTPPAADTAVRIPDSWRTDIDQGAPIDASWWRHFGDPELNRVVEAALAHNNDLALAVARVTEARATERVARSSLYPSVSAGAGAAYSRDVNAGGTGSDGVGFQPSLDATWEADVFGRIRDRARAAALAADASEAERDAVRLSVAASAASGYITLRALDARLAIVTETTKARAEALRIASDRAHAGYTSQLELRQAQAEYEGTAQLIPQAQLAVAQQENALSVLMGEPPRLVLRGLPLAGIARPAVPAGLPSDILRQRPDIARAEYLLAASDRSLAATRADFLPRLTLGGSGGAAFSTLLADPVGVFSLGGSILAPLFQGGALRGNLDAAVARRDQAAIAYRQAVLVAFREVEDDLAAARRLVEQRSRLQAQRTALAEALRHAENRYRAGYSSYLEQLDAQRNLLAVELSLVEVETAQLTTLVALHRAVGGGWERLETTPAP